MKKSILLVSIVIICFNSGATVITVDNSPNSPSKYTDLQVAINNAKTGDSIYVSGSPKSYGNITIDKRLTLLGSGANPQKQLPYISYISILYFDSLATSNSSGTIIEGFSISIIQGNSINSHPNNIHIKRNRLNFIIVCGDNWLIENNIMPSGYINVTNNYNITINNNILMQINNSTQINLVIKNNLFVHSPSNDAFFSIGNATITNNIFYGNSTAGCKGCIFNNNLTFNTKNDSLPYGNNTGSKNIIDKDPLFTFVQNLNYQFSATDNYILLPNSPGNNAGTDGKDIGPFGGSYPFPSSPIGGEPKIPQVKSMDIPIHVPVNGTIKLSVKAKKQD